ncbi:hypothetical protein ACF1BU_35120 [Streptomyces sp. NPDC014724]|nr:hypothetical protein [Nocardia farcinica]
MTDLTTAVEEGGRIEILKALRTRLISAMDQASPGVVPQYAKQIADLTREIDELNPKEEVDEVADAASEFADAIQSGKPKRAKKS